MGGEISVESRLGEGSRFSFEIEAPVKGSLAIITPFDQVITGYSGPRKTILVVDDLEENRRIICDMLTPLGFNLLEAENGIQCLKLLESTHPDIILMDVVMPEMDGIETTHHIRQSTRAHDLPIIAISASVSNSDEASCLDAGMNAFVPKPVAMDKLLRKISSLLKVEWINGPVATAAPSAGPIVLPPQQEIEILHQLALMGNMRDILQHAAHLVTLDEGYRPFADQMSQLAREYQSKAILSFVEKHLEQEPE
jgi:CheY-like chemotaxis protein